MFALNLLGGAALTGANGPVDGRAAHKRRIALLAILAIARGRTVGRERIIGRIGVTPIPPAMNWYAGASTTSKLLRGPCSVRR